MAEIPTTEADHLRAARRKQVAALHDEIAELKSECDLLAGSLGRIAKQRDDFKARVETLDRRLDAEREENERFFAANNELRARVDTLEAELADAKDELEELRPDVQAFQDENIVLRARVEAAEELARHQAVEIDNFGARVETLTEALQLCDGEDVRLNGCTCTDEAKCYLHGVIVAEALAVVVPVEEQRAVDNAVADGVCGWPMGSSLNLSVNCGLPKGHTGPHKAGTFC